jgi:hypothetical protein
MFSLKVAFKSHGFCEAYPITEPLWNKVKKYVFFEHDLQKMHKINA